MDVPGYEVIARLSRGRRLDVYDAWSHERHSRVILKALRPERRDDVGARDKLIQEGRLLESLTHPHIVRGYETITDPDPIVVMETLGGSTLGHLIETGPPPGAPEIGHLGLHLASAIAYLHDRGWLHLDLKPDNVVAEGTRAKVIDLSLVRAPGPAPSGIGTWCYLAPEQARGGELGPAADVWGIGATLYEAASGVPAFDDPSTGSSEHSSGASSIAESWSSDPSWESAEGEDRWDQDYPQLKAPAPRLSDVSAMPQELCDLVDACLEADPEGRPSIPELMALLEPIALVPEAERRAKRDLIPRSGRSQGGVGSSLQSIHSESPERN